MQAQHEKRETGTSEELETPLEGVKVDTSELQAVLAEGVEVMKSCSERHKKGCKNCSPTALLHKLLRMLEEGKFQECIPICRKRVSKLRSKFDVVAIWHTRLVARQQLNIAQKIHGIREPSELTQDAFQQLAKLSS